MDTHEPTLIIGQKLYFVLSYGLGPCLTEQTVVSTTKYSYYYTVDSDGLCHKREYVFSKDHLTPESAWQRFLTSEQNMLTHHQQGMNRARDHINAARAVLEALRQ